MEKSDIKRYVVKASVLPEYYPTHRHEAYFWECLGRSVASFGFLEEILTKAIFAFTATTEYPADKIEEAYEKWSTKLEQSLSDQLGGLITTYEKAVRENSKATITNLDELLSDLREASKIRNVLCHGSWRDPNENGASVPFFVNRKLHLFESPVDAKFLQQVQKHTSDLTCSVINTVTHMGLQFPGSLGPGKVIWGA